MILLTIYAWWNGDKILWGSKNFTLNILRPRVRALDNLIIDHRSIQMKIKVKFIYHYLKYVYLAEKVDIVQDANDGSD